MKLTINLGDNEAFIAAQITAEIAKRLQSAFVKAAPAIKQRIGSVCSSLILKTPEYVSLVNGDLMGELGLPDVEVRMQSIIAAIQRGVQVNVIPVTVVNGILSGGLSIGILRDDYEDILKLSDASYISAPSGQTIPWLSWLLTYGDQIILLNYEIKKDLTQREKYSSRTGKALMIEGSGWRVPPEYSGRAENNFLTRAFDVNAIEKLLKNAVQSEISQRLR